MYTQRMKVARMKIKIILMSRVKKKRSKLMLTRIMKISQE